MQPEAVDTDEGRPDGRPSNYYVVTFGRGPSWDPLRGRREQAGWDGHVAFINALAEEGFVVLGGPVGEVDGENALLVVDADSEALIRARLAGDPSQGSILTITSVQQWWVWLRAPSRA